MNRIRSWLARFLIEVRHSPNRPVTIEPQSTALDLIYQASIVKIEQQKREVDFLDTKAMSLLTAASLILTVAPAARFASRSTPLGILPLALLLGAGLIYAILMWRIRAALQERSFDFPPSPIVLHEFWLSASANEVTFP